MANKGPKNAKEYWKEVYAILMQSDQTDSKRKRNSGTRNDERAKRHRGEHANEGPRVPQAESPDSPPNDAKPSGYIPTVSTVEQANRPTRSGGPHSTEKDIELRQFLKVDVNLDNPQARGDLDRIYNAAMSFGQGKCKLVGGKWQLDNFGTPLYHHQLIGVSWMLSRELHPAAPTGGILADEMGLGKTVQLLACMSQNMPGKSSKASKTLIITPKRLTT
jgi:SNF2 family DNA or RNA helicase